MIFISLALVVGFALAYRLGDRVVAVMEKEAETRQSILTQRPSARIPEDITLRASLYSDEWARDAYLARAGELYEKTGDWTQVRALMNETDE